MMSRESSEYTKLASNRNLRQTQTEAKGESALGRSAALSSAIKLHKEFGNQFVQRKIERAKNGDNEADVTSEVERAIHRMHGSGQPLDMGLRNQMESSFGTDFSKVRLHTDSESNELNHSLGARAFATGPDIFFRQGAFDPRSSDGRELIAHELTHVVQQAGSQVNRKLTVGKPDDRYEQEADQMARKVILNEQRILRTEDDKREVNRKVEDGEDEHTHDELQRSPVYSQNNEAFGAGAERNLKPKETSNEAPRHSRSLSKPILIHRQIDEDEKEEFERDKMEIGILTKLDTKSNGARTLLRRQAQNNNRSETLSQKRVKNALNWYSKFKDRYTKPVIRQIQEKVETQPDGINGPLTIQAIASWQLENGLAVDGKAGAGTLTEMFGRDIRFSSGEEEKKNEVEEKESPGFFESLFQFFRDFGFSDTQSKDLVQGEEPTVVPIDADQESDKSKKRKYRIVKAKNFYQQRDGVSLKAGLWDKISRMANHVLDNDLVTGNVIFSSGIRSPKKAHRWSTAYQIRQGNVALSNLTALSDGQDLDGNVWYKTGWTMKAAKANAKKKWKGALAAEGYPKRDERRKPNTFTGGVTRHATGKAIDATFLWKTGDSAAQNEEGQKKLHKLKDTVRKRFSKRPKKRKKVLAAIEKFVTRGSFGAIAFETIKKFGLKRPVLLARSAPEDWHYEENK